MKFKEKILHNKTTLIVSCIVLFFLGLLLWFLRAADTQIEDNVKESDLVTFNGSSIEEKEGDRLVWRLSAEKILVDPKTNVMYFINPKAQVWEKDGTELDITSKKGIVDRKKRTVELKQPITAQTDKGDTLQTGGSVYYNMDTRLITGGKVLLTRADHTRLSGDSFETNAALDKVKVEGHAKITQGE